MNPGVLTVMPRGADPLPLPELIARVQALFPEKRLTGVQLSATPVLHSGSFSGLPGLVLMMIASLLMPLFAITGWQLYLGRRAKKLALDQKSSFPVSSTSPMPSGVEQKLQVGRRWR